VIRVVPRVERQEFVNAGVIVWCREQDMLEARVELDESRLLALDPAVDIAAVNRHLASISRICAGGEDAGDLGKPYQEAQLLEAIEPLIARRREAHLREAN
jgi:hypothetical protein